MSRLPQPEYSVLFLRGLITAIGGLAFIFLPGSLIALLSQRGVRYQRGMLLWGMAVLLVALLPATFLTSLARQIMLGAGALTRPFMPFLVVLLGSALTSLFVGGAMYALLRWRRIGPDELPGSGVSVGLGSGLLLKVFLGFALLGAGMRLLFGDTSTAELARIASQPWPELVAGLLALVVDRIAVVSVSAGMGLLAGRALLEKRLVWLWLAVAAGTVFNWVYAVIGLTLGDSSLIASLVAIGYEAVLIFLVVRWLTAQFAPRSQSAAGSS
ncbi:MAG TPA: hypothetical protein ENI95_14335 [Chloroflexi bacterium]|nr:hypothetical protein [Chloroflexota bacterium]